MISNKYKKPNRSLSEAKLLKINKQTNPQIVKFEHVGQHHLQFKSLIQNDGKKLRAGQFIKLGQPIFKDYIRNVKHYAKQQKKQKQTQPLIQRDELKKLQMHKNQSLTHKKITQNDLLCNTFRKTPSFYRSSQSQILSLKQFVLLLEQSKNKQKSIERGLQRKHDLQLRESVGQRLQSAGINMRLTTSYARKMKSLCSIQKEEDLITFS